MASGDLIVARCTNELGRALYAACTISAGDLILSDHPALLLEGNPSIPARIEALLSPSCQILRRHLFTPDPADPALANHPVLRVLRLLSKNYPDPASALRCALCWHASAFDFGGNTALFFVASLFAHSCSPNTTYATVDGVLQFRTLRDIAEGELLTISYLAPEVEIQGRRQRQDHLWRDKCFWCNCARCLSEKNGPPASTDANELASLNSLEDEVAALSHTSALKGRAPIDAPLPHLRERAEVLLGDQHWAYVQLLLLELDVLLAEQTVTASTVQLLKCASNWITACFPHLLFALLGSRLISVLAKRPESEDVQPSLRSICDNALKSLCHPSQRNEILKYWR